ncbi:kinase-like domain-containing protein [Aspergillus pseudodeflectus]|uniref:non-specific serine/threonine protein kinase n=1 Tax=Aspergillus pseudodeflectus TaxID=176178 RepID=A0ABR4J8U3_9EURO
MDPDKDPILKDSRLDAQVEYDPYSVSISLDPRFPGDLKKNQLQIWKRERDLGSGSYGKVWLEKLCKGPAIEYEWRAVKSIPERMANYKEIKAMVEFSRMKYERTRNFVKFYGWYRDLHYLYIAMEYLPYGTLDRHMRREMSEPEIRLITVQLLAGLDSMHKGEYAHRDLKPEVSPAVHNSSLRTGIPIMTQNIFVNTLGPLWSVKIGDFGFSKYAPEGQSVFQSSVGTFLYAAPEVNRFLDARASKPGVYDKIADQWSLGCVVYEMASTQEMIEEWVNNCAGLGMGTWSPKRPPSVSTTCWDFIQKLLTRDPDRRLAAAQALKHEWITTAPPAIVEDMESTTPVAKEIAKLPDEGLRRTITPASYAASPATGASPPVDINSTIPTETTQRSPTTVPGASGRRSLVRRSKQQSKDTQPTSHSSGSYDDQAPRTFSTDETLALPSSSGGTDLAPDSLRRTVVKRASNSSADKTVAGSKSYRKSPAPFETRVAVPSGLIPATNEHKQAAVDDKAWSEHIKSTMEAGRQMTTSKKDTGASYDVQKYDGEDYEVAVHASYKEQPQDHVGREKQVTFAPLTGINEEDKLPPVSDEDSNSSYYGEDYFDSFNTLFTSAPEDHPAPEQEMKIGGSKTAKETSGQPIIRDNADTSAYASAYRNRLAAIIRGGDGLPKDLQYQKILFNPKETSAVGYPSKKPGVDVEAPDCDDHNRLPRGLHGKDSRPPVQNRGNVSHKKSTRGSQPNAAISETFKEPSITVQAVDASVDPQTSMDMFSELPMAEGNTPGRRTAKRRQKRRDPNNKVTDVGGEDANSVTLSALPTHYVVWPGSKSHSEPTDLSTEERTENRDGISPSKEQSHALPVRTSNNSSWRGNNGSLRHALTSLFDEPNDTVWPSQKAQSNVSRKERRNTKHRKNRNPPRRAQTVSDDSLESDGEDNGLFD